MKRITSQIPTFQLVFDVLVSETSAFEGSILFFVTNILDSLHSGSKYLEICSPKYPNKRHSQRVDQENAPQHTPCVCFSARI